MERGGVNPLHRALLQGQAEILRAVQPRMGQMLYVLQYTILQRGIMIVRIQAIDPLRQDAEQQQNRKRDKMDTREETMKRMMLF